MTLMLLQGLLIIIWLATAAVVLFKFIASRDAGFLVLGVGLVVFPVFSLAVGPVLQMWLDSSPTPPLGMTFGEVVAAYSTLMRIASGLVLLVGVMMLKTGKSTLAKSE